MLRKLFFIVLTFCFSMLLWGQQVFDMAKYGIVPGSENVNMSPRMEMALKKIRNKIANGDSVVLRFSKGRYDFYPDEAAERVYYVSNHDQMNPKKVGIALEDFTSLTIEGNGAEFVFHGIMLPISLLRSTDCTLKDFSIDFENPHIAQVQVVENAGNEGITFRVAPWVKYRLTKDSLFETYGEDWKLHPFTGNAFEEKSRHIVYNTSDLYFPIKGVQMVGKDLIHAPSWKDDRLVSGTVVAMRTYNRPTPGIFLSHDKNTVIENVTVYYAQGMGLLAQLCDGVLLDGFNVCLRGENDPRYFTTQADATHFSQCKGLITSVNGKYEGMMDDAINVHGIYLKVIKILDDHTVIGRYMHDQAWGFDWGNVGDEVQFIRSKTMENAGAVNTIAEIVPFDRQESHGNREFKIRFSLPLGVAVSEQESLGIENLTWTPEVYFAHNTIRNNRARGALFSTPKRIVVEYNLFDHTSGTAILLCGDCNGWYETGACRDVLIRNNSFINALTSMFQFTNAVISICPEIPDLDNQEQFFHGGKRGAITIVDNVFETFDNPILYAKSVKGLAFKNNIVRTNNDYTPFHWNTSKVMLEKCDAVEIF